MSKTFSIHSAAEREQRKRTLKPTEGLKKMMDDGKPYISGEDLQTCWHRVHRCKQIQTRSNKYPLCSFPDQFLPSAFGLCLFPSMNQSESDQWRRLTDMFAYTAVIWLTIDSIMCFYCSPDALVWKMPDKHKPEPDQGQADGLKSTNTRLNSFGMLYPDKSVLSDLALKTYMQPELFDWSCMHHIC